MGKAVLIQLVEPPPYVPHVFKPSNTTVKNYWIDDEYQVDFDLSEAAERHLNAIERNKLYCFHCGSHMHPEQTNTDQWQAQCSHCGVAGPRADSAEEALAMAFDLFPA